MTALQFSGDRMWVCHQLFQILALTFRVQECTVHNPEEVVLVGGGTVEHNFALYSCFALQQEIADNYIGNAHQDL